MYVEMRNTIKYVRRRNKIVVRFSSLSIGKSLSIFFKVYKFIPQSIKEMATQKAVRGRFYLNTTGTERI